jgi:ribulose-phosphate 3-epimerase
MKAGVALNPHTPINHLREIIQDVNLVCLMSVNPGFGGQSFIENTFTKTMELKQLIKENHSDCLIEIDGGVTNQNAAQLISNGADVLVAGSHVFKSDDPLEKIKTLKNIT